MYPIYVARMRGSFASNEAYCSKSNRLQEYGIELRPRISSRSREAAALSRRLKSEKLHQDRL